MSSATSFRTGGRSGYCWQRPRIAATEAPLPSSVLKQLFALRKSEQTGILEVEGEGVCTLIYLLRGVPVLAEEGTLGETLGRLLLREDRINQDQYAHIIAHMTKSVMGS